MRGPWIPLEEACKAVCDRCRDSSWEVTRAECGEWWHGAEEIASGAGLPPMPCEAGALRNLAERSWLHTVGMFAEDLVMAEINAEGRRVREAKG